MKYRNRCNNKSFLFYFNQTLLILLN